MQSENVSGHGVIKEFRLAFADFWQRLPNKAFFFILLAAWLVLFQLLGNATLGYIGSQNPSLFRWMLDAYDPEGKYWRSDDGHGVAVPFVVLALFWWKRKELLAQAQQLISKDAPSIWGVASNETTGLSKKLHNPLIYPSELVTVDEHTWLEA